MGYPNQENKERGQLKLAKQKRWDTQIGNMRKIVIQVCKLKKGDTQIRKMRKEGNSSLQIRKLVLSDCEQF